MAFLFSDIHSAVINELGYSLTTISADQSARVLRYINDALLYFAEVRPDYYTEECEYQPAILTDVPEGTIASGVTSYDAALTSTLTLTQIMGATIVQDDEVNVVRYASGISPFPVKLIKPYRFTDGDVTIYPRSITPSNRKTIYRVLETDGRWIDRNAGSGRVRYIKPNLFFGLDYLTDTSVNYPSYFTYANGVVMLDSMWMLDSPYSFWFRFIRSATKGVLTTDEVDAPTTMEEPFRDYALGRYMIQTGDPDGHYYKNLGEAQILGRRTINA